MNRLYGMIVAGGLLAGAAVAQDEPQQQESGAKDSSSMHVLIAIAADAIRKALGQARSSSPARISNRPMRAAWKNWRICATRSNAACR